MKPEENLDKVEAITEKLEAFLKVQNGFIEGTRTKEELKAAIRDFPHEIIKLFPEYEPMDLEVLEEVVKDVKALASAFQFFTPMSVTKLEATLRDIPEGQLYRLKEKE